MPRAESLRLLVRSGSGNGFYTVSLIKSEDTLAVFCDCPAGEFGQLCKHKISILRGDGSMLVSPQNLHTTQEWIQQSGFPDLLKNYDLN